MSFGQFKSYFSQYFAKANEFGLGWLFVILIVALLIWYLSKGNKLSFRVPFLPRFMNKVSIDPKALSELKDKSGQFIKHDNTKAAPSTKANTQATSDNRNASVRGISLWQMLRGADEKRYKQPTYLLISDNQVQENQHFLQDLSLTLARKGHRLGSKVATHYPNWYHFDQGTIIHGTPLNNALSQAQQYRPERPLDGIIVSLSVKRLCKAERPKEIQEWANTIFQQIWETQNQVGFVLPIYLLLTETDDLPNFNAFWQQEALKARLNEPFGWLNYDSSVKPYQSQWIDEAMQKLSLYVRNIQIGIMAQDNSEKQYSDDSGALLFAKELKSLHANLSIFCDELFAHTIFQNPLVLRGLHFTGSPNSQMHGSSQTDDTLLTDNGQQQPSNYKSIHHYFVKDWLEQVVFPESGLAYAPRSRLMSSNKKLRNYQYASIFGFTALTILLLTDAAHLNQQTNGLVLSINEFPEQKETGPIRIEHIHRVFDHISNMDASKFNHLSMPFSWFTPFNERLTSYFDELVFDSVLFPAMECRMQTLLNKKLTTDFNDLQVNAYGDWLDTLSDNFQKRAQLNNLITNSLSKREVMGQLPEMMKYLYDENLPDSFFARSDLYIKAIQRPSALVPHPCFISPSDQDQKWAKVKLIAEHEKWEKIRSSAELEIQRIVKSVEAPMAFFKVSKQMQSLPNVVAWYKKIPEFSDELMRFNAWFLHMKSHWLTQHNKTNECQRIQAALQNLVNSKFFRQHEDYANRFYKVCMRSVAERIQDERSLSPIQIYANNTYPYQLSQTAKTLFKEVNKLNDLSFMLEHAEVGRPALKSNFYWSTDLLNQALAKEEEYENFAINEYKNLWLPKKVDKNIEKYFAQGIAMKQLQFSMNRYILLAQVETFPEYHPEHLRPINQEEADLAAAVGNFRKSMDSIMNLLVVLKKLEFKESYNWLKDVSQSQAYALLKKVDKIYRQSRVYQPLNKPRWSAHQYNDVLFGISHEGQLKDYIAAQSERANDIATEYAEPLIVFLLNTKGKYLDYSLFGKWQNTLIELNKKLSNDPANSLDNLESFMTGQLAGVNQSNCFKKVKDLVVPEGSDVFASKQRLIVTKAEEHCKRFRADEIRGEYAKVKSLFNQYLRGKAPFSQMQTARTVSPMEMKQFLSGYLPIAAGLIERMNILAWKDKRNEEAQRFITEMNHIATFFSAILYSPTEQGAQGLELALNFNVLSDQASMVRHLTQWQWHVGNQHLRYPGDESRLTWLPNQPITMSLQWADQSPYRPSLSGLQRAAGMQAAVSGNTLRYQADSVWSLIDFVRRHQSLEVDSESLNEHSQLLTFVANVGTPQVTENVKPLRAFARLTAYGVIPEIEEKHDLDSEAEESHSPNLKPERKQALAIPLSFPQAVPVVY
ncbi:type VI secretion system protein [Alteromonas sp. a30]|uniref:type VI secretion system protein n=1 Tax=Alteromonas sp. a30 TaxID=2730917 RepID=UPI002282F127|nr:type VI secretion system protein [Alteromonas sp. a30]MCY7293850.1 hypothetical protein [Alteromonas sp. a30]